jgi:hypothetical protein
MEWFATGSCAAAEQFGWFVGIHSGLFVDLIVLAMFVSSHAFRRGAWLAVDPRRRVAIQSLLRTLPWLLVVAWTLCAAYSGSLFFHCYATWLALGAAAVMAPALIVIMHAAANRIGRRSVRS